MKTEKIHYYDYAGEIMSAFPKGILLLTRHEEATNIMTIGWCLTGHMWNRPIFQAIVRTSRFTYGLLEKSNNFSVNVPLNGRMKEEVLFCGTHSGKAVDKIDTCRFSLSAAKTIDSPVISNCDLFLECKVIAKTRLPIEHLDGDPIHEDHTDNHFHIMYYGEIVSSYIKIGE